MVNILDFPTLSRKPALFEFGIKSNTTVFESALSSTIQTIESPSPRWVFRFSVENLEEEDIALIQSFFAQLRGMAGRFNFYNLARPIPRGAASGTPLVNGASQVGTSIITNGWDNNIIVFEEGDFFSIGGELKICTAQISSDGSGNATIPFEFPIRTSPGDASAIITTNPTSVFRLVSDSNMWSTAPALLSSYSIQGEEDLL